MTREYLGKFSALETAILAAAAALFVGAVAWVFLGTETGNREWRWLMIGALALSVVGRLLHGRRKAREFAAAEAAAAAQAPVKLAKRPPAKSARKTPNAAANKPGGQPTSKTVHKRG